MSLTEQQVARREVLTTVLEAVAAVLIIGGTAWLSLPAALIVTGLILIAVSYLVLR